MDAITLINSWHDFYLGLAAAAATLVGLLFIAVSLNIDVISDKSNHLRVLASGTLTSFVFLLIYAFLFLIPGQGTSIGISLIITAAVGLLNILRQAQTTVRNPAYKSTANQGSAYIARQLFWRFIITSIGYASVVVIGILALIGYLDALYWLVGIFITLLITALITAWELLLAVGRDKREGNATRL